MKIRSNKVQNSAIISSSLTLAQYNILKKGNPAALKVVETKGDAEIEKFSINYNKGERGSFGMVGGLGSINFNSTDREGHLCCVVSFNEKDTEAATKAALAEMVLPIQASLEALEASAAEAVATLQAAQAALAETVVID